MRGSSASSWFLLALLRIYKLFLSPFFGGACKYYPSCSNYAVEAIQRHGARHGVVLALRRLGRCRPFTAGGYDPVPEHLDSGASSSLVTHEGPLAASPGYQRPLR